MPLVASQMETENTSGSQSPVDWSKIAPTCFPKVTSPANTTSSDVSLSSALADLSRIRDAIHLLFDALVTILNNTDWGPIMPIIPELFNILLANAEYVFQPASDSELPLGARLPLARVLQGKLTRFQKFVYSPTIPLFRNIFPVILANVPACLEERALTLNELFVQLLPSNDLSHDNFVFSLIDTQPETLSFFDVSPHPSDSEMSINAESSLTCPNPSISVVNDTANTTIQPDSEVVFEPTAENTSKKFVDSVFVKPKGDWKTFITNIHSLLKIIPSVKMHGELAKITVFSPEDFITLKNHLSEGAFEGAALTPPKFRPRKFVIKGLPASSSCDDIASELKLLGFTTTQLVNMRHRLTKVPMPLFLADVVPSENLDSILDIKTLLFLHIKISVFTSKRPRQCYNCQRYGHSSLVCNFAPRCVKCAGEHNTSSCTKPKSTPATCALCGSDHTANFSGCPQHPDNRRNKRSNPNSIPKVSNVSHNPTSQQTNFSVQITPSQANTDSPALAASSNWGNQAPSKKRKKKALPSAPSGSVSDTSKPPSKSAKLSAPAATPFPFPHAEPSEIAHDAGVFFSVLSEIRELCSEFNMNDLLSLLQCTRIEMAKHSDVSQRFTVLFTAIFSFFGASSFMTPVPCEQRV